MAYPGRITTYSHRVGLRRCHVTADTAHGLDFGAAASHLQVHAVIRLATLHDHHVFALTLGRPLRITLLAEYYLPRLGGVETVVDGLGEALIRRGHSVRILTTTPEAREEQGARVPFLPSGSAPGLEVTRVPSIQVPAVGVPISPLLPVRMKRALADVDSDVVHVHASVYSYGALVGAWGAHNLGLPIVVTFHSTLGRHAWIYRLTNRLTGWGRWPDVAAAVSRPVADDVSRVLGSRLDVLPNGVDVAWWASTERRPLVDGGELALVTVQRLKSRKRGAALLEAVAGAQRRLSDGPGLSLTFVGGGPRQTALEEQAHELGVRVTFAGAVSRERVRQELAKADVFVLASAEEAFGLAATEARAAGLPVIAFRTGALPAIVPDGVAGILVDDDREMEDALVSLASERGLLRTLREGSERTPPPFDWSDVVLDHERTYREAIRRRSGRHDRRS